MSDCQLCTRHPHEPGQEHTGECKTRRADVGQICRPCASRIATNLDSILECWALTAIPPWPTQGGDGRAKSSPLPGSTEWIDWRSGCWYRPIENPDDPPALLSWAQGIADHLNIPRNKRGDLTGLIGWLRTHLEDAAQGFPDMAGFAREIGNLAKRGRTIAGLINDRGLAVSCPTDDCSTTIRVNAHDLDDEVTCKHCDRTWSAATLLNLAKYHDAWVDVETASRETKIPESTLARWAKAGKVERKGGQYRLESIRERIKVAS